MSFIIQTFLFNFSTCHSGWLALVADSIAAITCLLASDNLEEKVVKVLNDISAESGGKKTSGDYNLSGW